MRIDCYNHNHITLTLLTIDYETNHHMLWINPIISYPKIPKNVGKFLEKN